MESRDGEQLAHDALHADTASERTRANEALMSRVFGKPKETVERLEKPLALQAVEEMTDEELAEAWAQLDADLPPSH